MTWIENPPVVVLLARQFNPSVLSQVWLSRHGVLDEEGTVKGNSVFSGDLMQAVTDNFVLAVVPEQLQFIPNTEPDKQQALIEQKLGTIVGKLPHVPYHAIGMNFNWHLIPGAEGVSETTRRLFGGGTGGVYSRFAGENCNFGAYLSKDHGDFRMKLDIKPVLLEVLGGPKEDRIQFSFNFHSDLSRGEDAAAQVVSRFSRWNDVRQEVIETIKTAGYQEQVAGT